ncbi:MAG: hypothetical protein ABIH18_10075 [Candidatus Omnitrophota bacterium]
MINDINSIIKKCKEQRINDKVARVKNHTSLWAGNPLEDKLIKDIINKDEAKLEVGSTSRYINEILVLQLKKKINISHIEKYVDNDTVWRKVLPSLLEEAERCYINGHATAAVFFCRLTIEAALRDRIIKCKEERKENFDLKNEENRLKDQTLINLLQEAQGERLGILNSQEIENIFLNLKKKNKSFFGSNENIFNKFIHGDFLWIKKFIEDDRRIIITHEEETTKEVVAQPNIISSLLFIEILEATYNVLLLLYPNKR